MTSLPPFLDLPPIPPPAQHFTRLTGFPPTRPSHSSGSPPTPADFDFLMSLHVPPARARASSAISPVPSSEFDSDLSDEDDFESGDTNDFSHLLHAHVAHCMAIGSPGASGRALRGSRESTGSDSFAHNMPHMRMRGGPFPFSFLFTNHHLHGPGAREGVFQPFGIWNSDGGFSGDGSGGLGAGMGRFVMPRRGGYGGRGGRGDYIARSGTVHRWLGW